LLPGLYQQEVAGKEVRTIGGKSWKNFFSWSCLFGLVF